MPWAGNIAKSMTSNGKQFTVTRKMLTAVASDQRWPHAVAGISRSFSRFIFDLFCYITNHLMTGPLGNSEFCFPRDQSLSVKCFIVIVTELNLFTWYIFLLFLDSEGLLLWLVIIGRSSSAFSWPFCLFLRLCHVQVSFCIIWPLLSAGTKRWHCDSSFSFLQR